MTQIDPITRAVARNLCTGCGACAGAFPNAIRMIEDPVHGRRPMVEASAEGRNAARQAVALCGGVGADFTGKAGADGFGPVLGAWEGHASDPEVRHLGSSGGAVTALAEFALQRGLVQGVAHIAPRRDDPRLNEAVISTDRAGLLQGSGSRYAQASPLEVLGRIAEGAGPVALIGKPCDVASAVKARGADARVRQNLTLTIAIFCAGQPNLMATDRLLDRLSVPKDATLTDLRYRGKGWPGLMQARYRDAQGVERESTGISYAEGWGGILQAERRWRCRICADHTGILADISVGDPWHNPPKDSTEGGRSLIIARTPAGLQLIQDAIAAGALVARPEPLDVIARAQPNLVAAQGAVWGRRLAMRAFGLPVPADRGLALARAWWQQPLRARVASILGTAKRILRQRLWQPVVIRETDA
jgi:coenzyme F420 hydrogenase subunit beta